MFEKKQKSCVKRIHLVTDDVLYDQKAFYKVKIVFIHPLLLCFVAIFCQSFFGFYWLERIGREPSCLPSPPSHTGEHGYLRLAISVEKSVFALKTAELCTLLKFPLA